MEKVTFPNGLRVLMEKQDHVRSVSFGFWIKSGSAYETAAGLFSPKMNCFFGNNGMGKTNLLDAIHYLSFCKSHVNTPDSQIINSDQDLCVVQGNYDYEGREEEIFCAMRRYGPKLHGVRNKAELDELVETSLRGAALWDEVKDRLKKSALGLSGGQQQRLCIARALAVKPEVLLMDEPTSALDPGSTMKVEELMNELKKNYTVVIVTHNMQQAARISDRTAFFLLGELVEVGPTNQIFSTPRDKRTEDYISGRFG